MTPEERQEWLQSRCGCVGASRIADVCAKGKGVEATTRRNYKAELAMELLTGKVRETYMSWDMKRGLELEPDARTEYEIRQKVIVLTGGFVKHPLIDRAGASPDGFIGEDGIVQFKAPNAANHFEFLSKGGVPIGYRPQMHWELACTGRKWCDFASYHPDMPEHLQLFVARLHRDDAEIARIEEEVIKFNAEVDEMLKHLPTGNTLEQDLERSIHVAKRKASGGGVETKSKSKVPDNSTAGLEITPEDAESLTK